MSKDILLNKLGFLNWLLGPQTLYSIIWGCVLLPTHQNFVQDFYIYIFDAIVHFIIISEFLKFIVLLFYLFCSVGDPFKDTAGPSLHVLIKMLATITLVMAPIFLWELFVPIHSCSITPFEISAAFGTHFPWILRYFAQLGISMYIIMGAWFIGILILSWSE